MDEDVRLLVESEWEARLGVSQSDIRGSGVQAITAALGANAAMSFLFDEKCIVVVPAGELAAAAQAVSGLEPQDVFTESFLRHLVGSAAQVDGPSWHGYVNDRAFTGCADASVSQIDRTDDALVEFLEEIDSADVIESGFSTTASGNDGSDAATYWSLRDDGRIVAAGSMSEWRGLNADVGVLTHPTHRGRGLAARLVGAMVHTMLPEAGVIRYRALASNAPSLAVARRLGFKPYGQNYRARLP